MKITITPGDSGKVAVEKTKVPCLKCKKLIRILDKNEALYIGTGYICAKGCK